MTSVQPRKDKTFYGFGQRDKISNQIWKRFAKAAEKNKRTVQPTSSFIKNNTKKQTIRFNLMA